MPTTSTLASLSSATGETKHSSQPTISYIEVQNKSTLRYYAGWADKNHGKTIPVDGPFLSYTRCQMIDKHVLLAYLYWPGVNWTEYVDLKFQDILIKQIVTFRQQPDRVSERLKYWDPAKFWRVSCYLYLIGMNLWECAVKSSPGISRFWCRSSSPKGKWTHWGLYI